MSSFKSREEELKKAARFRDRIIVGLFIALIVSIGGLARAPHVIDVYQAPDPRYGTVSRQGKVPPHSVYAFADYIFTTFNHWPENGEMDYPKNLTRLRNYFTPQFRRMLEAERQRLEGGEINELRDRTRIMAPAADEVFTLDSVEILGPDAWVVYLDMHIVEHVDDRIIKDRYMRYPIRVVRYRISREANPSQLALDGYVSEPETLAYDTDVEATENTPNQDGQTQ